MTTPVALPMPARPAGAPKHPPRPASRRYWIGGVLIAIGVVGAILWVTLSWYALMQRIAGFSRMDAPGTTTIHLNANARQVVYSEHVRGAADLTAIDIAVTAPSGAAVPVGAYPSDFRYDVPDEPTRVGRAVASFRSTSAGDYTVTVDETVPGATVAIGPDLVGEAVPHVFGAAALLLVAAGGGGTLIWITARGRRRRA